MADHFYWNVRLLRAAGELALFNATTEDVDPDYAPVLLNRSGDDPHAAGPAGSGFQIIKLYRQKQHWWNEVLRHVAGRLCWCTGCCDAPGHPHATSPALLHVYAHVAFDGYAGMCLFIILRGLRVYEPLERWSWVAMLGLFLFVPLTIQPEAAGYSISTGVVSCKKVYR